MFDQIYFDQTYFDDSPQSISVSGIATTETFGTVGTIHVFTGVGISSAEAFGAIEATYIIFPLGIIPGEDYTTYAEVDPDSHISRTASTITYTGLTGNETAYVYKDFGDSYFSGDFRFYVDGVISATSDVDSSVVIWMVANNLNNFYGLASDNLSNLCLYYFNDSGNCGVMINEQDGADNYEDASNSVSFDTPYYFDIWRDESVGAYGTLYCDIYTSSANRLNQASRIDRLTRSLHSSKKDYKYLYGINSFDFGEPISATGWVSNLSLELSFGTPDITRVISPAGIASLEAFGTAVVSKGAANIAPTGIITAYASGSATVYNTPSLHPSGIATAYASGTAVVSNLNTITCTGIASAGAFGTAVVATVGTITVSGISSAESFGTSVVAPQEVSIEPTGIASLQTFGTAIILRTITVSGIASAEIFGTSVLTHIITVTGLITAEAFGTTVLTSMITVPSIATVEGFGLAALTIERVAPDSIASTEAFGTALISRDITLEAKDSIASVEVFGNAEVIVFEMIILPEAIISEETFGTAELWVGRIAPTGITSIETFGAPITTYTITGIGLQSSENHGTAILAGIITPLGIVTAEAYGTAVLTRYINPTGIVTVGAFGTTSVIAEEIEIIPIGIITLETFGAASISIAGLILPTGIASTESFGTADLPRYITNAGGIASEESFYITSSFYPDEGIHSVDGYVCRTATNATWSSIRTGVGTAAYPALTTAVSGIRAGTTNGRYNEIDRAIIIFYGGLAAGSYKVTAATLYLTGAGTGLAQLGSPTWNVFQYLGSSTTNLVATDYPLAQYGTTVLSTAKAVGDWSIAGENSFVLNDAGLALVNLADLTKLAIREATYDVTGTAPTWASLGYDRINWYAAENGASQPRLTVTYTAVAISISAPILPSGIASTEAFGTAVRSGLYEITTAGAIATTEALSTPVISLGYTPINPTSIDSLEAHGTGTIFRLIAPSGIASVETFGTITTTYTVVGISIASIEAFGTTTIFQIFNPTSIETSEVFGTAVLFDIIALTGITTGEAFGTAVLSTVIAPSSIETLEAFGVTNVIAIPPILPSGIVTAEAFGNATLFALIAPTGIESIEAFGTSTLTTIMFPQGIPSIEGFGTPVLTSGIVPTGIETLEAFGTAILTHIITLAGAIETLEAFETPVLTSVISPEGLESLEAFGEHEAAKQGDVTCTAIESLEEFGYLLTISNEPDWYFAIPGAITEEVFGTAVVNGVAGILPDGIESIEAVNTPVIIAVISLTGIETEEAFGEVGTTYIIFPFGIVLGEDYTTYTEVDPNSHISKTSSVITYTGLTNNETAYIYKDFGVDYFDGDFRFYVDAEMSSSSEVDSRIVIWQVANALDDEFNLRQNGDSYLDAYLFHTESEGLRIITREQDGNDGYEDDVSGLSFDTPYYFDIYRDEAIGTYGNLACSVYDSPTGRATQTGALNTLSLALHTSKKDFRYLYGLNSFNEEGAQTCFGTISNLSLESSFGTPDITRVISPAGIATAEAFGETVLFSVISPSGLTSLEAFGTAVLVTVIVPSGIVTVEVVNTPITTYTLTVEGIASTEAFGTHVVGTGFFITPDGLPSEESFGTVLTTYTITLSGITSTEVFGAVDIARIFELAGISTLEAFGTAVITLVAEILPSGIVTLQEFGTAVITYTVTTSGIATGETLSTPVMHHLFETSGLTSLEAFGTLSMDRTITCAGITPEELFGLPNFALPGWFLPDGIATAEVFGLPVLGIWTSAPTLRATTQLHDRSIETQLNDRTYTMAARTN